MPEKAKFFTTSARPGNFGEHLDFKATIDNWFDENRYIVIDSEFIMNTKLRLEELNSIH